MQIVMVPHSGVLAHVGSVALPVVGWYTAGTAEGGLALQPLVLNEGRIEVLPNPGVQFSVVGVSELWWNLVNYHNANSRVVG